MCVCVRACNRLFVLHSHLFLAAAAKCVYTTIFGHHCSLSWSLVTGPGVAAKDTNSFCRHSRLLAVFDKDHMVVNVVVPSRLNQRDSMPFWTKCCHIVPHLAPYTTRLRVAVCCNVLPFTSESLPMLKLVYKIWRGDCFFKYTDTYIRVERLCRIREI